MVPPQLQRRRRTGVQRNREGGSARLAFDAQAVGDFLHYWKFFPPERCPCCSISCPVLLRFVPSLLWLLWRPRLLPPKLKRHTVRSTCCPGIGRNAQPAILPIRRTCCLPRRGSAFWATCNTISAPMRHSTLTPSGRFRHGSPQIRQRMGLRTLIRPKIASPARRGFDTNQAISGTPNAKRSLAAQANARRALPPDGRNGNGEDSTAP